MLPPEQLVTVIIGDPEGDGIFEADGNLDEQTGAEVLSLFDRLTADGVALLVATHDQAIARSATRVLHLSEGRLS